MNAYCDPPPVRSHFDETPAKSRRTRRSLSKEVSRHLVTRGVFAVPILPSGSPDRERATDGYTVDFGSDGFTFEIATDACPETTKWLVGIEKQDGELGYTSVKARHVTPAGIGSRIDAEFLEDEGNPLSPDNLSPVFDPGTFQFRTKLPGGALQQWQELGVVKSKLFDCVIVCPRCRSLPTVRCGCRACGSIAIESDQFIHHFACAYVDLVQRFQFEDKIACPKCLASQLIVGADFEFLPGPHVCQDCGWSDKDLENISRCMACGFEFPLHQGTEQEVIGYYVDRLEPLDLLPAH